jgi:serine/threonine-protein kinase
VIGQRLGQYRILAKIGQGSCGSVYKAVHESLDRQAAIKVLHPDGARDVIDAARLRQEGRAVNLVRHPGLVDIYELGELPEVGPYLVMEYLEGETLGSRLHRLGRLPCREVLHLGEQIATAMAAAHAQAVVHRDLKPYNIMVLADHAAAGGACTKVFDFGIAKLYGSAGARSPIETHRDILLGTPEYMAPELWPGGGAAVADAAQADVYALGITLYQLLSGQTPFASVRGQELILKHLSQPPPPLAAELNVPAGLERLIRQMLHKSAAERPSMSAVAAQLLAIKNAPPENRRPTLAHHRRQRLVRPLLALTTVAAGLVALSFGRLGSARDRDHRGGAVVAAAPGPRALPSVPPLPAPAVCWRLASAPSGAAVIDERSGALLGHTPWQQDPPSGSASVAVVLRLAGHADRPLTLLATQSEDRHEVLQPVAAATAEPAPPRTRPRARPRAAVPAPAYGNHSIELLDSRAEPAPPGHPPT